MAKQEYDKTPLEVVKVASERLPIWARAVAQMDLDQVVGESFKKNKPVEYEKLQNILANYLVAGKTGILSPTHIVVDGKVHNCTN
jgi:hypothetical protein